MKTAASVKVAFDFTCLVVFLLFSRKRVFLEALSCWRTRSTKLQVALEKETHNYPWATRAAKGQPHINRNYSMQKTRRGIFVAISLE